MKAHELLARENGWCQGISKMVLPDGTCQYCIEGALWECYGSSAGRANWDLQQVIKQRPSAYNDTPGRTQQEVVALLKELDI